MRILLGFAFCALTASALHANGLSPTPCPTNETLQSYEDQFSSQAVACSDGILNFSNFSFQLFQSSGPGTPLTASEIDLTPVGTPGQLGITGFTITGLDGSQITVQPGQDVTYVIDWLFVIDPAPIAGGSSLGMDPPFGDVTVNEYYCLDSNFQNGPAYNGSPPGCTTSLAGAATDVQSLSVTTTIPNDLFDSVTFNPPGRDYGEVMTVIQLNGGTDGSGFDSVTGDVQIESPVPEPGTLLLFTGALLVLGFSRRRARPSSL